METKEIIYSDLPIPPGEYLEEAINELGMSKNELAKRLNRPASKLSAIFKGEKSITTDTALQLEKVIGVPAHIWTTLESEYRLTLARQKEKVEKEKLNAETAFITKFCYADLVKLKVVEKKTRPVDKVLELQKFFGVASLNNVSNIHRYQPAFRLGNSKKQAPSPEAIAAWLRIGETTAQKKTIPLFDVKKLKKNIYKIKKLLLSYSNEFQNKLSELLSEAGVFLIFCPHLQKTYVQGATFWLGRNKAVLMITIRGSWADIFWFSLFHELGHILLHDRKKVFIESNNNNFTNTDQEQEADKFAAETLIPPLDYNSFVKEGNFYKDEIISFAEKVMMPPCIIVGRLQHDRHIKNSWHNDLRIRYKLEA